MVQHERVTQEQVTEEPEELSTIDSLRTLALEDGFDYRDADPRLVDRWGAPPFSAVGHRRALDVLTGQRDGVEVVAFRFVVGEMGRTAHAANAATGGVRLTLPETAEEYLVVAAALPSPLPRFSLAPQEDAIDEIPYGYAFECEDADLAEQYDVYAADVETAGAVMHKAAVAKLREHRTVDWRVEGRDVIAVERLAASERSSDEVLATIDTVVTIVQGIETGAFARWKAPAGYPPPA
jgi:hypothetical protein